MQHKNVMHLLIPCLTEPEKLFPLKLSQLPEKSKRTSMPNSSKGEVQFLSLNKASDINSYSNFIDAYRSIALMASWLSHSVDGILIEN